MNQLNQLNSTCNQIVNMKTIKEYIKNVFPPTKAAYILDCIKPPTRGDKVVGSLQEALRSAFLWSEVQTPIHSVSWADIIHRLDNGEDPAVMFAPLPVEDVKPVAPEPVASEPSVEATVVDVVIPAHVLARVDSPLRITDLYKVELPIRQGRYYLLRNGSVVTPSQVSYYDSDGDTHVTGIGYYTPDGLWIRVSYYDHHDKDIVADLEYTPHPVNTNNIEVCPLPLDEGLCYVTRAGEIIKRSELSELRDAPYIGHRMLGNYFRNGLWARFTSREPHENDIVGILRPVTVTDNVTVVVPPVPEPPMIPPPPIDTRVMELGGSPLYSNPYNDTDFRHWVCKFYWEGGFPRRECPAVTIGGRARFTANVGDLYITRDRMHLALVVKIHDNGSNPVQCAVWDLEQMFSQFSDRGNQASVVIRDVFYTQRGKLSTHDFEPLDLCGKIVRNSESARALPHNVFVSGRHNTLNVGDTVFFRLDTDPLVVAGITTDSHGSSYEFSETFRGDVNVAVRYDNYGCLPDKDLDGVCSRHYDSVILIMTNDV